jgi:hypothetical protein
VGGAAWSVLKRSMAGIMGNQMLRKKCDNAKKKKQ